MIINYIDYIAEREEVIRWLEENVPHDRRSSTSRTGFDKDNRVVYTVYCTCKKVFIREETYAAFFKLKYGHESEF